jgi:arylsulfatase A-like enzyme
MVLSDHGFEAHGFGDPVNGKLVLTGGHETPAARDGLLIARGADIAHGVGLQGMSIADVTPTILAWLGLPVGADMDGVPAHFVGPGPFAQTASYDALEIEREAADASSVEGEIVEQLRGLGYLE